MGRIKTKQIKRYTRELMKQSDDFTTDFAKNKVVVEQVAVCHSKKIRNVIAGYSTRLVKERMAKEV